MVAEELPFDRMQEMVLLNRVLRTFDAQSTCWSFPTNAFNTGGIRRATFITKGPPKAGFLMMRREQALLLLVSVLGGLLQASNELIDEAV